ncbi:hypothetical protein [Bartonella sp. CB74]|uniref:hypothetical protein n=1 Tax=Bartonella sp. CB74 TaxID=3113620 RepID=UPI002F965ADA
MVGGYKNFGFSGTRFRHILLGTRFVDTYKRLLMNIIRIYQILLIYRDEIEVVWR